MAFFPCHGRADAPDLERYRRRLQYQGEVRVEYIWNLREDELEAVLRVGSFLPLVEDEEGLGPGVFPREVLYQREHHGVSGLHVRGATTVDPPVLDAHRQTALWLRHSIEVSGEDETSSRTVGLRPVDDEVVRDALRLPACQPRHARLQVVAERLLFARDARALEEPEQVLEQTLPQTLTPNCRRASFREVF
jgi:hypothetical protein